MVALNRIITKTGDDGTSALANGERRLKSDPRFEAIGAIDELNATVGLARVAAEGELNDLLSRVQNDLFDLGADIATPDDPKFTKPLRVTDGQVIRLESEAERFNAALSPLRSFVLPGGTAAAAALHLCRTVCRRAERTLVGLVATGEAVNPAALRFINRLSDVLFILARVANQNGRADILWTPGENR